ASLIHTTCAWSGDEPWPRRRVATESQYAALGVSMRSADWPPTAQSITLTRGFFMGSALALGTNAENSIVALLIPIEIRTIRPAGSGFPSVSSGAIAFAIAMPDASWAGGRTFEPVP